MTNIEFARELIKLIGDDPKQNEILKGGLLEIIKEPEKNAVQEKPKAKPKEKKTKKIDWPKAEACRKAGWDYTKIADELGCSYATVYAHFNKEGTK